MKWEVEADGACVADAHTGETIAELCDGSGRPYCKAQNLERYARLIAAAPDLLAACKASLRTLDAVARESEYFTAEGVVADLRAAVAKAGGAE